MREHEITHDRIAFPQHEVALDQCGNTTVRIHLEIMRLIVVAKGHSGIDTVELKIDLMRAPEHFLDIDRIGAAPDRHIRRGHRRCSLWRFCNRHSTNENGLREAKPVLFESRSNSAPEEQPQQKYDRDRYANQPEQKSFTHISLP